MRCNWCGKGKGKNYTKDKHGEPYYYYCESCFILVPLLNELEDVIRDLLYHCKNPEKRKNNKKHYLKTIKKASEMLKK